jgi:hypothetical protein
MLMLRNHPGACVPFAHSDWAITPPAPGNIRSIRVETVLAETANAALAAVANGGRL